MTNALAPATGPFIPDWTFAEKFRKARKIAGLEQREFADALGLTPSTVAAYETGRSEPRFRDAAPLAKRIQVLTRIDYTWFLDIAPTDPDTIRYQSEAQIIAFPNIAEGTFDTSGDWLAPVSSLASRR